MPGKKASSHNLRSNERIKAAMVRLVLANGEHVGVVTLETALARAEESGGDLVEIVPDVDPPVCKVLDYGKFKYHQKKRQQKSTHHRTELKGMRIGFATEEHDLAFKANRVREFLGQRHKVLISMRLAGRQRAHVKEALEHMQAFSDRLMEDSGAKVERPPTWESAGRITMLISPK